MEKIYSLLIILFQWATSILAQDSISQIQLKSTPLIKYHEFSIEGGVDLAMIFNDSISQKLGSAPLLSFYYQNYFNDRFKYSLFFTPVVIHITTNEMATFRERYFQIEGGITGSYSPFNNFWLSGGVGYAYRLYKDYKVGANRWTETDFSQPNLFLVGSVEYWFHTEVGVRATYFAAMEGYGFRVGLFANFNYLLRKLRIK